MTISFPDLTISLMGQMYLMSFGAFLMCWIANRNSNRIKRHNIAIENNKGDGSDGRSFFWTFVSIVSAVAFILLFVIGTMIKIAKGVGQC